MMGAVRVVPNGNRRVAGIGSSIVPSGSCQRTVFRSQGRPPLKGSACRLRGATTSRDPVGAAAASSPAGAASIRLKSIVSRVHSNGASLVIEATGVYHFPLAQFAYLQGLRVIVTNPGRAAEIVDRALTGQ